MKNTHRNSLKRGIIKNVRVIELFDRSHFSSVSLVVCLENRKQREEKYELAMIIKIHFSTLFIVIQLKALFHS